MERFLRERLDGKLEQLKEDDPKREALIAQFRFDVWIQDAARRVSQIQVVTHSLKAIHPDAKGTNLYVEPASLGDRKWVGSHVLRDGFASDVVGNAAALDVYKFLKLEYDGTTLLERVLDNDPALAAALSDDEQQAHAWMQAFAGITRQRGDEASHTHAKQLYWLVGDEPGNDDAYHLLAPLHATSLTHRVFLNVNEDRFGEEAKVARKARREDKLHATGYRDYPNLAVQKLGGTKPQNISQLNSERGGNNYLFASLPPVWRSQDIRPPLHVNSLFERFGRRREVKRMLGELRHFLATDPGKTMQTRDHRDHLVAAIVDALLQFAAELQQYPEPGWSGSPECQLNEEERLWLDPGRAEHDSDFHQKWMATEWPKAVRERFARWLNHELGQRLPVGDAEYRQWTKEVDADPKWDSVADAKRHWMSRLHSELDDFQEELAL